MSDQPKRKTRRVIGELKSSPIAKSQPDINPIIVSPQIYKSISVNVIRPGDLLLLDFNFINFKYVAGLAEEVGTLQRVINDQPAYIIVRFPQQSIMEKAFFELDENIADNSEPQNERDTINEEPQSTDPPVLARISSTSQLVFRQPEKAQPIPYSIEGLLNVLRDYPLQVASTALPPRNMAHSTGWVFMQTVANALRSNLQVSAMKAGAENAARASRVRASLVHAQAVLRSQKQSLAKDLNQYDNARLTLDRANLIAKALPRLAAPDSLETSIEAPYRLIISPNSLAAWVHSLKEVTIVHKRRMRQWPIGFTAPKLPPELPKLVIEANRGIMAVTKWPAAKVVITQPASETVEISRILNKARELLYQPALPLALLWYENLEWMELWHTRLATRLETGEINEDPNFFQTVRAIWAKDAAFTTDVNHPPQPFIYNSSTNDDPYRDALDARDRFNIVHLSANYHLTYVKEQEGNREITSPYEPLPITVDRLMLSTLGSWLNLRGAWNQLPKNLIVEEWRHRSTMARDHYVRVVYQGYLFPFGHRAALVKVSERKFHGRLPGNPAYLRQRMYIVVREPELAYGSTGLVEPGNNHQYDLAFPFTRVRITTLVTPLLDNPDNSMIINNLGRVFRPMEGSTGRNVRFHIIAEDLEGRKVEFCTPMIFAEKDAAADKSAMDNAQTNFTAGSGDIPAAGPAELNGQAVSFAASQVQGDTTLYTERIWFGAQVPEEPNFNRLKRIYSPDIGRFYPRIEKADVRIPAIQHLAGNKQVAHMKFPATYLSNGFLAGNVHQVFAEMIEDPVKLTFAGQSQRSGGLLTPDLQINGLSRLIGPVGGAIGVLGDFTSNGFDPAKFFAGLGLNPKLFGVIDLWEIIMGIADIVGEPDAVPRFITQSLTPVQRFITDLTGLADQMEGMVTAQANALKTALDAAINQITDILATLPGSILPQSWQTLANQLGDFATKIDPFLETLKAPEIPDSVRILLEGPLSSLKSDLTNAQQFVDDMADAVQLITDQKVNLDWKPKLKDWIFNGLTIFDTHGGQAFMHLHAEADARATLKGNPSYLISCGLEKFDLNLIGKDNVASFMILHFTKLEFVYSSSQKADINVDLEEIEFVGVLSFVEALKSLIPLEGFKDPPDLDISEKGISASYTMALPTLAFGMFSLSNMSLSAGFSVPFIGDPISVRFAFCTRENPFTLAVTIFGGGGFFGIALQPDGLQLLEASFEFGASLSVNFGVASGGVHIMAGIYFKMDQKTAALTGYFRLGGNVSVLGIISASIELYLSLTYEFSSGKCVGRAELTIEVSVLFFSVSVKITCERKFAGSSSDPTFAEVMAPYPDPVSGLPVDPWVQYCEAFA